MTDIDLQKFQQPYVGDKDAMQAFLSPVRTTAELADATDEINTKDKFAGRLVWDSTLGQPVWADGATATSTWSLATGVVSTTPS